MNSIIEFLKTLFVLTLFAISVIVSVSLLFFISFVLFIGATML